MGFLKDLKGSFNGGREIARKEAEEARKRRQEARELRRKVGDYTSKQGIDSYKGKY